VAVRRDGSHTYGISLGGRPTRVLFIGSSPDETDSSTGIPFTGFAGRVLGFVISELKQSINYCMTHQVCCRTKDISKLFKPDGKEYLASNEWDLEHPAVESGEASSFLSTPGTYAEVYNVGRLPRHKEIQLCSPHITQLIQDFKPDCIVTVGFEVKYPSTLPTFRLFAEQKTPFQQYIEQTEYKLLTCRREANKLSRFLQSVRG
jgi:uracil-DNA glycosylase